jgi:mannitol-1-phosphate/altronate dehydrogenase
MIPPVPLSHQNLALLPVGIARPVFAPAHVRPGIVHLGLGGFHRAHMARYTHDLMNIRSDALDWGIIGVGLMPNDRRMQDALAPQNGLYTLVERQDDIESVTVIGSVHDVIFAGESAEAVVNAITSPAVRIVSITVTENGYCLNPATKQLDLTHLSIVHDLAHPELPRSAIGIIVEAYRRRMVAGLPAFTALTCDNIQHNGAVLRGAVLQFAQQRDPRLAIWIEAHASFPGTMVDRITPVTTTDDIGYLASRFGVADRWPVFSELFRQWVIEDNFVQGRPAWELVGAQFADDVAPYEFMKLRLLNASHLAIAGLGRLAGYTYIDETLRDGSLRAYMQALMDRETGPTVPAVPGVDLEVYKAQLLDRFANPKIKDTVERVNTDAPINLLIDPIRDRLKSGADVALLALALAAWMRRVRAQDEGGQPIHVVHPLADLLRVRAIEGGTDPRPLLAITSLFGELSDNQSFVNSLERWLGLLYGTGSKATLALARRELNF